jgi:Leucine Rich repeat
LSRYFSQSESYQLRELTLVGCRLSTAQLVRLLQATQDHDYLSLDLSENAAEDVGSIITAVAQNQCPAKLALRLLQFHCVEDLESLINAISVNKSLKYLDIAGMTTFFEITDERVSKSLEELFRNNNTLQSLDISGYQSRLEHCHLGHHIANALSGLASNMSLEMLRIENQRFGLEGAKAIAEVLKQNRSLRELHISGNNIALTGFKVMVDALKTNTTLVQLSKLDECKTATIKAVQRQNSAITEYTESEISEVLVSPSSSDQEEHHHAKLGSLVKSIGSVGRKFLPNKQEENFISPVEVENIVTEKWEEQQKRLEEYLARNALFANELGVLDGTDSAGSPTSEVKASNKVRFESLEDASGLNTGLKTETKICTVVSVGQADDLGSPSVHSEDEALGEERPLLMNEKNVETGIQTLY